MSELVGNPLDRFSHDTAHIIKILLHCITTTTTYVQVVETHPNGLILLFGDGLFGMIYTRIIVNAY